MATTIKIICGPTASGKSARAIDIAEANAGVIINADAMQVYRELRILTARPTGRQEALARHALYGVLSAGEACSAGRWLTLAKEAIDEALGGGRLPVVAGGTGLYIQALMKGLSPIPPVPQECRDEAARLYEAEGEKALAARDAPMHGRLKAGDRQRHVRALEVWLATGKSLAYWQEIPRVVAYPDAGFDVEYISPARDELYRRCDARFLHMLEEGALEEVRALHAMKLPAHLPAMRAVGVPELLGHIEGKWDLAEATQKAQQATRNYAKRQVTWFKRL